MLFGNKNKFSVLEHIVLVYRTLIRRQLVPLVRPGHRKIAPTESVSVGARHDQVAVVSRPKSRSMCINLH